MSWADVRGTVEMDERPQCSRTVSMYFGHRRRCDAMACWVDEQGKAYCLGHRPDDRPLRKIELPPPPRKGKQAPDTKPKTGGVDRLFARSK